MLSILYLSALLCAARILAARQPNFIFIITDDQDAHLDSIAYQPAVQKHFVERGTSFTKHFCTVSLCCPSRVSLLTGKAAHNTNVTDVRLPYGGYPKFVSEGLNENYLPIWLQEAGYDTYYTGKLMNGLSTDTYNCPHPKGWTRSDFLLDPYTYIYNCPATTLDKATYRKHAGNYSTDLIAKRAVEFLGNAIDAENPFFIAVAPIAPHAELIDSFKEPVPADRHKDLFLGAKVPRRENFNPAKPEMSGLFSTLPRLNNSQVEYLDNFQRRRLQSLQAVDDLIEGIMSVLGGYPAVLENTYLIYTSDNGYHLGQHRLPPGKTCNIEEDVNVPFIARGPGIAEGASVAFPTSHTDLAPTFLQLAGIPLREDFDGVPIPITDESRRPGDLPNEHVNIEFWGRGILEGEGFDPIPGFMTENTYKTLRIVGDTYEYMYTIWCTGDHQLFDMKADPVQMKNLYQSDSTGERSNQNILQLTKRLETLLLTLKNCKGISCQRPWETVFPSGHIRSLRDAMDPSYDVFFDQQPRVSFNECTKGYIPELEGPPRALSYTDLNPFQYQVRGERYV